MMRLAGRELAGRRGHEVGRELLRELYLAETGCNTLPEIVITERGKPCFAEGKYHFSITHTPEHVFCALSDRPVGIDAEELTRFVVPSLAGRVLSPGEMEQYQGSADPHRAILTFWVLKEAAVKLTGQGLQGYPNDTDFRLDDPRVREWMGCLVAVMTE